MISSLGSEAYSSRCVSRACSQREVYSAAGIYFLFLPFLVWTFKIRKLYRQENPCSSQSWGTVCKGVILQRHIVFVTLKQSSISNKKTLLDILLYFSYTLTIRLKRNCKPINNYFYPRKQTIPKHLSLIYWYLYKCLFWMCLLLYLDCFSVQLLCVFTETNGLNLLSLFVMRVCS